MLDLWKSPLWSHEFFGASDAFSGEILDGAFPYLAPGGTESPAHMRDVGRLMASLGHDDWAKDVQDKFQFEPMRRRPKTRFSHDIQGRESSRGALC